MISRPDSTPKWVLAVIIILMLPLFQFPFLLSLCEPGSPAHPFLWIYPFYALLSGYLAYICYPTRRAMAWILLILLTLSHISLWLMVNTPIQ